MAQTVNVYNKLRAEYPNGHPSFIGLCLEEMKLHSAKNADYAKGGDPLGNFHRVSEVLNHAGLKVSPAMVAFIYMMKQMDAAGRMLCSGYEGQVEGLADRLMDIGVYAKLIQILRREEETPVFGGGSPSGRFDSALNLEHYAGTDTVCFTQLYGTTIIKDADTELGSLHERPSRDALGLVKNDN